MFSCRSVTETTAPNHVVEKKAKKINANPGFSHHVRTAPPVSAGRILPCSPERRNIKYRRNNGRAYNLPENANPEN